MLVSDSDRKIIAAALAWCGMEYLRIAKAADAKNNRPDAARFTAVAGECARLADTFQPGAQRASLTAGEQMAIGAGLETARQEFQVRAWEAQSRHDRNAAVAAADFAAACDRLATVFKRLH